MSSIAPYSIHRQIRVPIPPTKLAIFAKMAKKQAQKVAQFVLISAAVSRDGRKVNKKRKAQKYSHAGNETFPTWE